MYEAFERKHGYNRDFKWRLLPPGHTASVKRMTATGSLTSEAAVLAISDAGTCILVWATHGIDTHTVYVTDTPPDFDWKKTPLAVINEARQERIAHLVKVLGCGTIVLGGMMSAAYISSHDRARVQDPDRPFRVPASPPLYLSPSLTFDNQNMTREAFAEACRALHITFTDRQIVFRNGAIDLPDEPSSIAPRMSFLPHKNLILTLSSCPNGQGHFSEGRRVIRVLLDERGDAVGENIRLHEEPPELSDTHGRQKQPDATDLLNGRIAK